MAFSVEKICQDRGGVGLNKDKYRQTDASILLSKITLYLDELYGRSMLAMTAFRPLIP
jgi:hypothetical protein